MWVWCKLVEGSLVVAHGTLFWGEVVKLTSEWWKEDRYLQILVRGIEETSRREKAKVLRKDQT